MILSRHLIIYNHTAKLIFLNCIRLKDKLKTGIILLGNLGVVLKIWYDFIAQNDLAWSYK